MTLILLTCFSTASSPVPATPSNFALSPTLKSYGFSLFLHSALVAALYAFPVSSTQRFSARGQSNVISIEARHDKPAVATATPVMPVPLPISSQMDSPADQIARVDPTPRILEATERVEHRTLRKPVSPPRVPPLTVETRLQLERRPFEHPTPEVAITAEKEWSQERQMLGEPVVPSVIPIDQFVGLEEESSADLSGNRPPEYPLEAIRRRLQGAVLLRLQITKTGEVRNVEIIRSSGHPILDRAAVNAVSSWQGKPARRWGRAVETAERLPIRFRL